MSCRLSRTYPQSSHGLGAEEAMHVDANARGDGRARSGDMIRLEGVGKTYPDGTTAVQSLDLAVRSGETVALVGPSGCGKTTTLKMINRLIEPTSGRILLD